VSKNTVREGGGLRTCNKEKRGSIHTKLHSNDTLGLES
jgi:hypothetical protein